MNNQRVLAVLLVALMIPLSGCVSDGSDGAQGEQGVQGPSGSDGTNGIDGIDGINGTNGTDGQNGSDLSLIHISEPTRPRLISYAVFCLNFWIK